MIAKALFEKAGYVLVDDGDKSQEIWEYQKDCPGETQIIFDKLFTTVSKRCCYTEAGDIKMKEMKAINKRLKEMRWIK